MVYHMRIFNLKVLEKSKSFNPIPFQCLLCLSEATQILINPKLAIIFTNKVLLMLQAVRAGCEGRMQAYGFPWPPMLDCDKFPLDNDMCITAQSVRSRVATKIFEDSSWTTPPQQKILIKRRKIYSPPLYNKFFS